VQPRGHGKFHRIKIDVVRESKEQAVFSQLVLSRRKKGVWDPDRKDLTRVPTERVRKGKIGVEGLPDFRKGLGLAPKIDLDIYKSECLK